MPYLKTFERKPSVVIQLQLTHSTLDVVWHIRAMKHLEGENVSMVEVEGGGGGPGRCGGAHTWCYRRVVRRNKYKHRPVDGGSSLKFQSGSCCNHLLGFCFSSVDLGQLLHQKWKAWHLCSRVISNILAKYTAAEKYFSKKNTSAYREKQCWPLWSDEALPFPSVRSGPYHKPWS